MNTCETCKWWSTVWRDYDEPVKPSMHDGSMSLNTGPPDYEKVLAPGTWGQCNKVAEFGPQQPSDRFYVSDGSDYMAWLQTRSDFGCVEWEARDD